MSKKRIHRDLTAVEIAKKLDELYLQINTEARDYETALLRRTERLNAEVDLMANQLNRLLKNQ